MLINQLSTCTKTVAARQGKEKAPKRLSRQTGSPDLRRIPLGVVLGLFLAVAVGLADFARALLEIALQFLGLVARGLADGFVDLALDLLAHTLHLVFVHVRLHAIAVPTRHCASTFIPATAV